MSLQLMLPFNTNSELPSKLDVAPNFKLGMRYFIPDWDDRVDPHYHFEIDRLTKNRNSYLHDRYAHQIYSHPNYDGIVVSKSVLEKSKKKRQYVEDSDNIHEFLHFQNKVVLGDCGAFSYINEKKPPYTTDEILDYYINLGFDYGVSIDHLIVGDFARDEKLRQERFEITQNNAEEFLRKHKSRRARFIPIGVAQGWSPESYAEAVKTNLEMGYKYIGLGGLVRTQTKQIIKILEAIFPYLQSDTHLHLFGVARIEAIAEFRRLGITSFDSASPLRSAWLDSAGNYHTLSGQKYAAIRVPPVNRYGVRARDVTGLSIWKKGKKNKSIWKRSQAMQLRYLSIVTSVFNWIVLKYLEQYTLQAIRKFDRDELLLEETLEAILKYDELLELPRNGNVDPKAQARRLARHAKMYRQLLEDRPWKQCNCIICQEISAEVIIFRGNDRNRRRGFHNTYVFYKKFKELLDEG